jgi:hypothetical protein
MVNEMSVTAIVNTEKIMIEIKMGLWIFLIIALSSPILIRQIEIMIVSEMSVITVSHSKTRIRLMPIKTRSVMPVMIPTTMVWNDGVTTVPIFLTLTKKIVIMMV